MDAEIVFAAGDVAFAVENLRVQVPVIFDTDKGPDYDDVGAIAVLDRLADLGEARILAMGSSNHLPNSVKLIGIFNRHFGRAGIPVGSVEGPGANIGAWHKGAKWTEELPKRYSIDLPLSDDAPDAAAVYRRALASSSAPAFSRTCGT